MTTTLQSDTLPIELAGERGRPRPTPQGTGRTGGRDPCSTHPIGGSRQECTSLLSAPLLRQQHSVPDTDTPPDTVRMSPDNGTGMRRDGSRHPGQHADEAGSMSPPPSVAPGIPGTVQRAPLTRPIARLIFPVSSAESPGSGPCARRLTATMPGSEDGSEKQNRPISLCFNHLFPQAATSEKNQIENKFVLGDAAFIPQSYIGTQNSYGK